MKLRGRFHYIKNYTQLEQLIRRGNYAILGKVMDDSFVPMDYLANDDLKVSMKLIFDICTERLYCMHFVNDRERGMNVRITD